MPAVGTAVTRRVTAVVYGVLAVELVAVVVFAATYNALDFRIYMWGGHAVRHDDQLYLALAYGHWFTYSPFAALVYVPIAALPLAVARVGWDLLSMAALAYSCVLTLKLAGGRPSRIMVAGVAAAAVALDPVWQTLFLGQVNLILLALILTDVWRVSRGSPGLTGLGVGIAAAVKLTPAIFIVFFLLARRTRAACVAAGTFVACGLVGFAVAPHASTLYWEHLSHDTGRVGAPYISNQSPYAAAIRIAGGQGHIGWWWVLVSVAFAVAGLAVAAVLARRGDWLGATAVTGTTGLLVSPISWAHHWVWVLPALVLLVRAGHRVAAAAGYLLFALAPFWFTPHAAGPREYGFHWLLTLVANCFLIAGVAFLAYMALTALRPAKPRRPEGVPDQREDLGATGPGEELLGQSTSPASLGVINAAIRSPARSRRPARRTAARPRPRASRPPAIKMRLTAAAARRSQGQAEIWSAGSKHQFTALRAAPGVRLFDGAGPAKEQRRQRTAAPPHPPPRTRPPGPKPAHPRPAPPTAKPRPARTRSPAPEYSRRHGVPEGTSDFLPERTPRCA